MLVETKRNMKNLFKIVKKDKTGNIIGDPIGLFVDLAAAESHQGRLQKRWQNIDKNVTLEIIKITGENQ